MTKRSVVMAALCAAAAMFFSSAPAAADIRLDEGMWRLELSGSTSLRSGRRSRTGDVQLFSEIEYEVPVTDQATLGLRLLPLFVYEQDDSGLDTVWGAGAGVLGRYYFHDDNYHGLFAEVEAAMIGHSGNIDGNSSNFNFVTGAGVGYQWHNHWNTTLSFRHISNAGLGDNSGANFIGLSVGYRF